MSSFICVLALEPFSPDANERFREYLCQDTLRNLTFQAGCLHTWWGEPYQFPNQTHLFVEWTERSYSKDFLAFVDKDLLPVYDEKFGVQLLSPPATFEIVPTLMGACDPDPDCMISVYFLRFPDPLAIERRRDFLFKLDQFRQDLQRGCACWEGVTNGWAISESPQSGDHNSWTSLMIVLGWTTVDDARHMESDAKIPGTKMASVYDRWFQPILDAAQAGWTKHDISLHLYLEGLHR